MLTSFFVTDQKKKRSQSESFYDLFEDYDIIEASFAQQYGIRLRAEDEMQWDEFVNLLAGLNGDTPLGYMVRIRSEKDPKIIKGFSRSEKKIREEWRSRHKPNVVMTLADTDKMLSSLAQMWKG